MKKTTVKKTVVKFLMRIVFAVLLLLGTVPASNNRTAITAHAAAKNVKPAAVKKIAKVKATKTTITVKWSKSRNASGYQVRAYKNSKLVRKTTAKAAKATIKGLKAGTKYTIKIRAYRKSGKKTTYSAWKAVKIKTANAKPSKPSKPETTKKRTDKQIAADGYVYATTTVEMDCGTWIAYWENMPKDADISKVKWSVSDSRILKIKGTPDKDDGLVNLEGLKLGKATVTLTYAGIKVGSKDITVIGCPPDWSYWEPGLLTGINEKGRYEEVKKFNEHINNWVAKNITKDMSEYEKAVKAATYVKNYMAYNKNNYGQDMVTLWNRRKGGVCAHATGIMDCFLRKMQIDTCCVASYAMNHSWNWAMLDGQAYTIDATFGDCDGKEVPAIYETDEPKPDDGTNAWRYPTE